MALIPVEEAKARILKGSKPLAREIVALHHCAGRVLAADIKAKRDQPPFPASAMDGYAVRFGDVGQAPVSLRVIGTAPAGHAFQGKVEKGEAVRIFTGAPVPKGADTVVIQENTEARAGEVRINTAAQRLGQHIRRRGIGFRKGRDPAAPGHPARRPRDRTCRRNELAGPAGHAPTPGRHFHDGR